MVIASQNSRLPALPGGPATMRLLAAGTLIGLLAALLALALPASPAATDLPSGAPLAFEPNRGQHDARVRYTAAASNATLFFTDDAVSLSLTRPGASPATLQITFVGAAPQSQLVAEDQLPGVVNYIEGSDASAWQLGLPTYRSLRYQTIYPGIALHYAGASGQLKSTYLLETGADPALIRWRYQGAEQLRVDPSSGDLLITLPGDPQPIVERAPIAWQELAGHRTPVSVRYQLYADQSVGFALGGYNRLLPLVIDPTLEFSTYLGGAGADRITSVTVDPASGDIFVAGRTSSATFPGSPMAIGSTGVGTFPNAFVARVRADGTGTVYRTIIGGTNDDEAMAISVDDSIAAVVGTTYSSDFPIAGAYDTSHNGDADMFALLLSSTGTLSYSTFLGGISADTASGVAFRSPLLTVVGSSDGPSFGTPAGGTDALALQIDTSAGAAGLEFARRIGGFFNDTASALALDGDGNIYITGLTRSDGIGSTTVFPITGSALQPTAGGSADAFITQIDATGVISYSTFLGGSGLDEGLGIAYSAVDGRVYVTGRTLSSNFPSATGTLSGQDAFVFSVDLADNAIGVSRLLGSPGLDEGRAIAIDSAGAAYIVGSTSSTDFFELNPLAEMASAGGNTDAFVTRFDAAGAPTYSTRLGGSSNDYATGVAAVDATAGAQIYVAGYTNSANFPQTTPPTAIQSSSGGDDDGFLVRIGNARPTVDLNDGSTANGIDFGPASWTEAGTGVAGSGPVAAVAPTALTVSDTDSPLLSYAEARFVASTASGDTAVAPPDGASESLSVTLSGGITGVYSSATGTLRLTAASGASPAAFQAVLRTLAYNNSSETPTAGARTIAVEIGDGIDRNSPLAFSTVNVVASNDAPTLTAPASASLNEEATAAVSGLSVADADLGSGSIQVALTLTPGSGTLSATAGAATLSGSGTRAMTVTGTLSAVNAALGTVQVTGALDFNGSATLTVAADDLGGSPAPAQTDQETVSLTISAVNDAPVVAGPASLSTREDTPLTISLTADLGMSDAKDTTAPPAAPGAASFPPVTSITVTTPPASGSAGSANLVAGTFVYTPSLNFVGSESFTIQVCDLGTPGSACSSQPITVTVGPVNDRPSFTSGGNVTVAEDSGAYSAAWAGSVSAGPTDELTQTLTFQVSSTNTALFTTQPAISSAGTLTFTPAADASGSATVTVRLQDNGGTANGGADTSTPDVTFTITVTPVNDRPSFTPGGNVTVAEDSGAYSAAWASGISAGPTNELTQTLTFQVSNTNNALFSAQPAISSAGTLTFTPAANASGTVTVTVRLQDSGGTAGGGADTSTPDATFTITITPLNDPPTITPSGGAASYTENAAAIAVDAALTLADGDSTDLDGGSVSVSITAGGDSSDALTIVDGGSITVSGPNISFGGNPIGTFSGGSAGSALTVSLSGASATPAAVQALLRQVRYSSSSDAFAAGSTTPKTVTFQVSDGDASPNQATATRSLTVDGLNDAPTLDNSGVMSLNSITESQSPNTGTLVSAIIASAGIDAISDADSGALEGIAISAIDAANGTWEYSTNGGASWSTLAGVTSDAARLLGLDARVRFVPNAGFNGTVASGITFVAWDRTSGANGTTADPTPGGGTTAFSTASEAASIVVIDVNLAPVLNNTGTMSLSSIVEDLPSASNTGTLISAVIASAGFDAISDADASPLEGIAIIGTSSGNGTWEFSTDDGASWSPVGAPTSASAVLLASQPGTRVRFLPNPNFSGTIANGLTFYAWDQTTGTNGQTGVDATATGGSTAFSTAFERAGIIVTPVNDQPTATDDAITVPVDSVSNTLSVLANDSIAPDIGETLTITNVTSASFGSVSIAPGGGSLLYTPSAGYQGNDSFSYTISDGNGGTATATVRVRVGPYFAALPIALGTPIPPDLVITNFSISPAGPNFTSADPVTISVTIENRGTATAGAFWVDLYINPSVPPTAANQRWDTRCGISPCYGIAWLVSDGIPGGGSVTLTSVAGYEAAYTRWLGTFARGTTDLYVYVDSWNGRVPYGAVQESDESNNRAEIHGITVRRPTVPATASAPPEFDLPVPERPLPTRR